MGRESYQSRHVSEVPAPSGVYSQSGDTGALKGYGGFDHMIAQLEVTNAPAPSGTLNVYLENSLDGVNWWPVQSNQGGFFPQNDVGLQLIHGSDFAETLRVRWDITPGSQFTFNVKWQLSE